MLRPTGCAMSTVFATQVVLALFGCAPAFAQSSETPGGAPGSPPAVAPLPARTGPSAQSTNVNRATSAPPAALAPQPPASATRQLPAQPNRPPLWQLRLR